MTRTLALGLLGVVLAEAAQAAPCAAPYTVDTMLTDLANVEAALRADDSAAASAGANKLEAGFACLSEVIPVMIVGRAYRAVGAGKIAGGDSNRGMEWFRTATEMEQAFDYGLEDIPAGHPVLMYYADAKNQASGEVVLMEEMSFIDGEHWVDGRKYKEPKARLDRPHVYQLVGGGQVMSWIITGNGFPPDVLKAGAPVASGDDAVADAGGAEVVGGGKPPKEPKEPKGGKEPKEGDDQASDKPAKEPKQRLDATSSDGTVVVQRQRPAEKTPLLIGGGAILAGAGGIYFAATRNRTAFDNAESLEEIERLQTATNQLVIASAATLGVGTGVLTWGIILDGGAPLPAVGFRF